MAAGFRKSLFGFHCGDVMDYIERIHKNNAENEKKAKEQINRISDELALSQAEREALFQEKEELSRKLDSFHEKYEEIERLSDNIGKLYLVAQANAQAIMSKSEQSAQLADSEIQKNLYTIEEAHSSLEELRSHIIKTSGDFVSEVDGLIRSLTETREKIADNTKASAESREQFDEVYKSVVK